MFIVHVHCSLFMFIVHCSHGATLIFDDLFSYLLDFMANMQLALRARGGPASAGKCFEHGAGLFANI